MTRAEATMARDPLKSYRAKRQWLLVKIADESADARRDPVSTEDISALSGRTSEAIAHDEGQSS